MNNHEKGEALISRARRIVSIDLEGAMRAGDFNMVVRRAQEAVELALKGALAELGIEYPKVHDVGGVFADAVRKKVGDVDIGKLARIGQISTRLSEVRAPAFYGEKLYDETEAMESRQDALFVLEVLMEMLGESPR